MAHLQHLLALQRPHIPHPSSTVSGAATPGAGGNALRVDASSCATARERPTVEMHIIAPSRELAAERSRGLWSVARGRTSFTPSPCFLKSSLLHFIKSSTISNFDACLAMASPPAMASAHVSHKEQMGRIRAAHHMTLRARQTLGAGAHVCCVSPLLPQQ